jgi:hypothetical protein
MHISLSKYFIYIDIYKYIFIYLFEYICIYIYMYLWVYVSILKEINFMYFSGNNLRDALLDHLITLIHVMKRVIRKHQATLVALVCKFLDSHLQPCLDIIESMCIVLQVQDFNNVLRDVMPTLMQLIKEEPISETFFSSTSNFPQERSILIDQSLSGQSLGLGNNPPRLNDSGKIDKSKNASISGFTSSLNLRNTTTEKILATLPKTLKIFQLIVNVEHSLGEFRRLLLPVFVKVLVCLYSYFYI